MIPLQSFKSGSFDLSRSIYKQSDLENARNFYADLFAKHSPEWETKSCGVLSRMWRAGGSLNTERLVDIAIVLSRVSKGLAEMSKPAYSRKVQQLLNCAHADQFEEHVAELRVGAFIADYAPPVVWEPFSKSESAPSPNTSPDFCVMLPDGEALIEGTVLRVGAFNSWEKAMEILRQRVGDAVVAAGLSKEVEIRAPLGVRGHDLSRRKMDALLRAIKDAAEGATEIDLGNSKVFLFWHDLEVHSFPDGIRLEAIRASRVVPILDKKIEDILYKSIKNTIDGKREQLRCEQPTVLVLQSGSWRLPDAFIYETVSKRFWPNSSYTWLTGIAIGRPRMSFEVDGRAASLTISWNPNAKASCTRSMADLFEGRSRFSGGQRR